MPDAEGLTRPSGARAIYPEMCDSRSLSTCGILANSLWSTPRGAGRRRVRVIIAVAVTLVAAIETLEAIRTRHRVAAVRRARRRLLRSAALERRIPVPPRDLTVEGRFMTGRRTRKGPGGPALRNYLVPQPQQCLSQQQSVHRVMRVPPFRW